MRLDKDGTAGQYREMIRRALCMAVIAVIWPMAAPAAEPEPVNAVSCIYAGFTPEDREIALLLIAREISQGGKFSAASPNFAAVDALIDDGLAPCSARFHWDKGRAAAARDFTLTALLAEAIDQSLQASGRSVVALEQFYLAHPGANALHAKSSKSLAEFLRSNGWKEPSEQELVLAGLFVDALALKHQASADFSTVGR